LIEYLGLSEHLRRGKIPKLERGEKEPDMLTLSAWAKILRDDELGHSRRPVVASTLYPSKLIRVCSLGRVMSSEESILLTELLNYVRSNNRVCPIPWRWNELYQMLPGRRSVGNGWEPALPLILAAWWDTPALLKILRLEEHIRYAADKGVLN
jgi:hypothetical protein